MNKSILVLTLLILSMSFVLAESIEETTIHIKINNDTIELINPDYSGNNMIINLTENNTIISQEFDFPIIYIKNETVDGNIVDDYTKCLVDRGICETEKSQFNQGYTICVRDFSEYKSKNNESVRTELNQCILEKNSCNTNLDSKNNEITKLNEETENNKNGKFGWLIAGIIAGILGLLLYQGKIGNNVKSKVEKGEFNPRTTQ